MHKSPSPEAVGTGSRLGLRVHPKTGAFGGTRYLATYVAAWYSTSSFRFKCSTPGRGYKALGPFGPGAFSCFMIQLKRIKDHGPAVRDQALVTAPVTGTGPVTVEGPRLKVQGYWIRFRVQVGDLSKVGPLPPWCHQIAPFQYYPAKVPQKFWITRMPAAQSPRIRQQAA
jgi:hypothetical protein